MFYTDTNLNLNRPISPSSHRPSIFRQSLSNRFLQILTDCVKMDGPDVYLSSYKSQIGHTHDSTPNDSNNSNNIKIVNSTSGLYPMVHIKSRLQRGWSFTSWIRLARTQSDGVFNLLSFEGLIRVSIQCTVNPVHLSNWSLTLKVESVCIISVNIYLGIDIQKNH